MYHRLKKIVHWWYSRFVGSNLSLVDPIYPNGAVIFYSMGKIYFLAFIYSLLNDLNNFSVHILAKVIFNNDIATRIV